MPARDSVEQTPCFRCGGVPVGKQGSNMLLVAWLLVTKFLEVPCGYTMQYLLERGLSARDTGQQGRRRRGHLEAEKDSSQGILGTEL